MPVAGRGHVLGAGSWVPGAAGQGGAQAGQGGPEADQDGLGDGHGVAAAGEGSVQPKKRAIGKRESKRCGM
jgi:hypothetical protein